MRKSRLCLTIAGLGFLTCFQPITASADKVADFYKGKTISFRVGFGPGGGFDIAARIVAKRLGTYIPGNPTVVVENMPGASGMLILNDLYNVAPRDGTVIGLTLFESALEPLGGNESAKFDPSLFTWIGSIHSDSNSCGIWKGAGQNIKSWDDFLKAKDPVIFGTTGPQGSSSKWALFLKHALGAPVKVVHGYKTSRDIVFAMAQGEVHAMCGFFESSVRSAYFNEYKSGDLKFILQVGDRKAPLFGDAVQITEAVKGMGTEMDQIVRYVFGPSLISRPVVAPPGVPQDRAKALRKALIDTMRDPQIVADGKKIGLDWEPMTGDELNEKVRGLYSTPKEIIAKAINLIEVN